MDKILIRFLQVFMFCGVSYGAYVNVAKTMEAQAQEERMILVKESDYYFLDAPDNNIYPVRTFKDHFYAKWLEAWQHVVLSQQLQTSLNMCMAGANNGGDLPCLDSGDFSDGGGQGLWKPKGDPNASCKTTAVFLLPSKYVNNVETSAEILDSDFNVIDSARFKGNTNPNRPTFCTTRFGEKYGAGPIYVRYTSQGVKECRIVNNPSIRID